MPVRPMRDFIRISAVGAALALSACASSGQQLNVDGKSADYKDAIGVYSNPAADPAGADPVAAAAYWSVQYDRDPNNWQAAVKYSSALRKIGSIERAVNVMMSAVSVHSEQPLVAVEAGKALIEAGRAFEAIRYLEDAERAMPTDWQTISAHGVALDQIGEHAAARLKYEHALSIAPGAVSLLNNKGMSFALSGNLSEAARILRTATSAPGADARVRQNLALVLAIKGDMREAERLARSDLPPQIADQNIDYYRSLVAQPSYWQDFAAGSVDTPKFDDAPPPPVPDRLSQPREPAPSAAPEAPSGEPVDLQPAAPVVNSSAPGTTLSDSDFE